MKKQLLASCILLAIAGCGNKNASVDDHSSHAGHEPETAAPIEKVETATASWTCPAQPGTAPSGELVAERIPGANTTRTEAGLYEGPVWIGDKLYFSDFLFSEGFPSRIQVLHPDGTVTTAIENSGSNGLAATKDGMILAATHDRKAISIFYDPAKGERDVLVNKFEDDAFNSPNDLTISSKGILYFTDPDYQRSAAPGGQPKTRVYQFDGVTITVVDDSLNNPNGISLSPDESTLYVAGGSVLRAYPIEDGNVGEGRDIAVIDGPDGMAVDCLGNLYVTEHGQQRIRVISPAGEDLAVIKVDANVTNAAFGGPERKTLFITGAGAVWKLDLQVAGLPY
ncbi:SMP-30/gluconolactonase/LRE family protein [Saccharophagus sp. K07]|uniref:SMP-30/gluconolactonase/LRE family protein n=1 Tax=Saccharophagus sp. K07 TaxID=2283636 RepID=UPI0016527564|nr:SMP-30/gluconolactonase/LRE family protein [Saccharophagus sp. K07]MBC6905484.1 SMP-30/gluconolactonase/LRE family protein [Saccharophagus sp. K07]